jgi:transposase
MPGGWVDLRGRRPNVKARGSMMRKKHVIEYSLDPEGWKERIGYGRRWVAEIFFSSFKRIFGEHVRARKFGNMVNELMIKATVYNLFISM